MAEFIAIHKDVEVNGQTILSVLDGMAGFESMASNILMKHGIKNPQPDMWYSQQAWLNAFKDIALKVGSLTLKKIGASIPENAQWPPEITSIEPALQSIDIAYHMNHRLGDKILFNPETGQMNEGIGHYKFSKIGEQAVKIECDNPYPCAFDQGIIKAVANKFKPLGYNLRLKEHVENGCRQKGGEVCTYTVEWYEKTRNPRTF